MPFQPGNRLPGERASRLGHLDVLNSELVKQLVHSFELAPVDPDHEIPWQPLPNSGAPLDIIFAVDGSLQILQDELPPRKAVAFVKTALMRMDQVELERIDKKTPHPFALRDLMADAAMYHATVFPLRNVKIPGMSVYHAVRRAIFESVKDASLKGEPMETLKWLAYQKWLPAGRAHLPEFACPHCESDKATLPFDAEQGPCPKCGELIYVTDSLGFHLDMVEESASDAIPTAYMQVHETLMLFTGIRHYWETNRETLKRCLFLKDGPLQIRAQYSKLVAPIRNFLLHADAQGVPICIVGQEKTGFFVDHFDLIKRGAPADTFFLPDHKYICEQIQHRPAGGAPYGKDTNYGAKIFLNMNDRYHIVLTIPVSEAMGNFIQLPSVESLIGFDRIIATLPGLLSSRYENALLPVELAHSIASLSTYPSAQVLKLFTSAEIGKT